MTREEKIDHWKNLESGGGRHELPDHLRTPRPGRLWFEVTPGTFEAIDVRDLARV